MKELEKLLTSLIRRGRNPYGEEANDLNIEDGVISIVLEDFFADTIKLNLRSIVGLESGLWQFVCKNKLLSDKVDMKDYLEDSFGFRRCPFDTNGMYRIMQSALYSEEDLPQFLIDNIKVEG